jgi:hypothetical protein
MSMSFDRNRCIFLDPDIQFREKKKGNLIPGCLYISGNFWGMRARVIPLEKWDVLNHKKRATHGRLFMFIMVVPAGFEPAFTVMITDDK